ncbi:uncharacterized protein ARMOST_04230 [Armillaria ostoyae]|uniref:Uncharacterized protein n=1 Tax=Armillaria ostoyae TaxID=47428 RepID=A0A284QWT0_ARMOS|nr:uncharacterized protein ARMOST_04230 [Armillaria ostoyae]
MITECIVLRRDHNRHPFIRVMRRLQRPALDVSGHNNLHITSMSGLVRNGPEPIQACIESDCFSCSNGRHFSEQTAECYGVLLNYCIKRMPASSAHVSTG